MLTRNIKLICLGIYLFHFSITQYIMPKYHVVNFFPFFDWNLFAYNPPVQIWPMIRILEVNHQPLSPPTLIYHNGMIPNSTAYWTIPEQMSRLLFLLRAQEDDKVKSTVARKELEKTLFHDKQHVKYQVFYVRINVRDHLFQEKVLKEYPHWTFEYHAGKNTP